MNAAQQAAAAGRYLHGGREELECKTVSGLVWLCRQLFDKWSTLALIAGLGMIVAGVAVNSRKQKIKHYKVDAGDSKTRA
mgnify:CR=1 FL=1